MVLICDFNSHQTPQIATMVNQVLKRKRSDSEISTTSSLLSSPLSSSNRMSIDSFQSHQISTPSLFASRTRKRHRDNRPSESDVHQHTLSLLFSAQQASSPNFHAPFSFRPVESIPASNQPTQQSSLHSFWNIPSSTRQSSPSSNSSSSANTPNTIQTMNPFFQATNCEDCDASLTPADNGDAMDVDMMMDIDMDGGNHACTSCGKQVCHGCAISNLGSQRMCLNCAGRKAWNGGIGWCNQD